MKETGTNQETQAPPIWRTPKRLPALGPKGGEWYPYYAGFTPGFAADVLKSLALNEKAVVLDPWNGTGTTTEASSAAGIASIGVDLNPAMVVVARARTVSASVGRDLRSSLTRALKKCKTVVRLEEKDPLLVWLTPTGVRSIRSIQRQAARHLGQVPSSDVRDICPKIALVYTALFRAVRQVLSPFRSTNPTWIKPPKSKYQRLRPSYLRVRKAFFVGLDAMLAQRGRIPLLSSPAHILLGSSDKIPLSTSSVDAVVTSPPYCTRLDYAVATAPELSVLGLRKDQQDPLRRLLIGSPLVRGVLPPVDGHWGPTCLGLLEAVRTHPSKDSAGYYMKHFIRYFDGMFASLREVDRVLRPQGKCVLVVQDSFYKEHLVNLQQILSEMMAGLGWTLGARRDYHAKRALSDINPASRRWRDRSTPCESVLLFDKG